MPLFPSLAPELLLPAPVLVVEDDPLIRQRLRGILMHLGYNTDALLFAENLTVARRLVDDSPIALALVDLGLPDGNGIELITELRNSDPALGILVISAWSTEDILLGALRAGATGYVLKERDDLEVSLSIRSVLRGGAPIDPFIARRIIAELQAPAAAANTATATNASSDAEEVKLTARESQILSLVADGLANREIAEKIFLSRYTVECHIKHIYRKLAVSSRVRAVKEARARGILT